jgi:hypothetical protein
MLSEASRIFLLSPALCRTFLPGRSTVPSAEVVNLFTLRSSTAMPPKRAAIAPVS